MNPVQVKKFLAIFIILLLVFMIFLHSDVSIVDSRGTAILSQLKEANQIYLNYKIPKTGSLMNNTNDADGITTRWAVVIACSGGVTYGRHERRDKNDVRVLKKILRNNGWEDNHIFLLSNEEATTEAILNDSFNWLINNGEDEDDIIFFFFSGHGYYHTGDQPPLDEPDGRDEIIHPWDPDMAGWNPDVVIVDDVLAEKFHTLKSKNIVIIIHTCHAGGWIDGEQDLCESGRVVMVSCGVDESSCMMKYQLHWLFPYYLIQGLRGFADKNGDKCVSAEECFDFTIKPVQFRSKIYNWMLTGTASTQNPEIFDGWPTEENNDEELMLIRLER